MKYFEFLISAFRPSLGILDKMKGGEDVDYEVKRKWKKLEKFNIRLFVA